MEPQSQNNRSLNSIVRGSNCLIFKPVEFAPGDTTLAWANKVVNPEKYKDHLSRTTQPITWRRELYDEFSFQFG